MAKNAVNMYDIDSRIPEIYDQIETQTDDVKLIRQLIRGMGVLRILEPFCGNGRILIPLAQDGHEMVGLDQAGAMLDAARKKIARLPEQVQKRITLVQADATTSPWPRGFDLVILGANCFYELATPQEQEGCVTSAAIALTSGGYVYVDNNHMEGELHESWRQPGVNTDRFPTGISADGTRVQGTTETIWFDAPRRLVRFRRTATVTRPDGSTSFKEWIEQKHPPSTGEVRGWLERQAFVIEHLYGDRAGNAYTDSSSRAILWARKDVAEEEIDSEIVSK